MNWLLLRSAGEPETCTGHMARTEGHVAELNVNGAVMTLTANCQLSAWVDVPGKRYSLKWSVFWKWKCSLMNTVAPKSTFTPSLRVMLATARFSMRRFELSSPLNN